MIGIDPLTVGLNGLPETQTALLNQIHQKHAVTHIVLCQLDDPGKTQICQLLFPTGLFGALGGKNRLISKGGNARQLLQIQPQRVAFFQKAGIQSLCRQKLLLTQTGSGLAGAVGLGKVNLQRYPGGFQLLQNVLQSLGVLPFQQCQKTGRSYPISRFQAGKECVHRIRLKGKFQFIHSKSPPIPGFVRFFAACP